MQPCVTDLLLAVRSDFTAAVAALALVASSFLTRESHCEHYHPLSENRLLVRGLLLWRRLRREKGVSAQEKERHRINLHMFFRVLILGFTELLALVMCIVSISGAWKTRIADLVVAGSESDVVLSRLAGPVLTCYLFHSTFCDLHDLRYPEGGNTCFEPQQG